MSLDQNPVEFISIDEAALRTRRTRRYLMQLCRDGVLKAERTNSQWLVDSRSLDTFVRERSEKRARFYQEVASARAAEYGRGYRRRARGKGLLKGTAAALSILVVWGAFSLKLPAERGSNVASVGVIDSLGSVVFRAVCPIFGTCGEELNSATSYSSGGTVKSHESPAASQELPASTSAPTASASQNTVVNNPIVERIIERAVPQIVQVGTNAAYVDERIQQLDNKLTSQINQLTNISFSGAPASTPVNTQSFAQSTRIDQLSGTNISNATIHGGSISGISIAAGDLSGVVGIASGGTGTSTAPVYGQLLLGNAAGGYSLVATSSLGISNSGISTSTANTWGALQLFSANASSSQLSAFQKAYFGGTATTTIDSAGNLALGGTISGAGLASCSGTADKLLYDSVSGHFSCGTDQSGGSGGTDVNWTFFNGTALRPATTTNQVLIGSNATTSSAKLQVIGGAFFDNATSSNLAVTNVTSSLLKANVVGNVVAATAGTDFENPLTFAYPFVRSTNAISLAFGTTTSNTWAGTQVFTNAPTLATFSGLVGASSGVTYAISTTSLNASITGNASTVTNGVYTTTFGTLFDNRLSASTSVASITTLSNLASVGTITSGTWQGSIIGSNYGGAGTVNGILKANGSGVVSAAVSGTDYAPATSGSSLLYGNGAGGFSSASVGASLTFSGGALSLNTGNANSWTALQNLANASSSKLSAFQNIYFGGTATSTFDSAGNLALVSNGLTVGTNQLVVSGGDVGIGTTTPFTQLTVAPASTTAQRVGQLTLDSGHAYGLAVQGRYAYVAADGAFDEMAIYDFSNPASPVLVSTTTLQSFGQSIAVQGQYAYLADNDTTNSFEIWNISNPKVPVRVSASSFLHPGYSIAVSGHYVYVGTSGTTLNLEIWDVANPAAPVRVSSSALNNTNGSPNIFVQGNYAYIVESVATNGFEIWNISNPAAPYRVSQSTLSSGSSGIYVQGHYAYITDGEIWDVKNPAAPSVVSSTGASGVKISVAGRYAYIVKKLGSGANSFIVEDISSPAAPAVLTTNSLNQIGDSIAVSGRYAIMADDVATNGLEIWDLGGAYIQNIETGALEAGTLSLTGSLHGVKGTFTDGITVAQSLNVSGSASFSAATSTFNTTMSIFSIATASSSAPSFSVLGNGNVGVGTSTPFSLFSINPNGIGTIPAFTIGSSTATWLTVDNGGKVGVGTSTPFRRFSVTDTVSAAQVAVAYDATRYTQFQTDAAGDFHLNPSGQDFYTDDSNLWICTGGSCPAGTITGTGNIVAENKIGIGTSTPGTKLTIETQDSVTNFFQVASSTAQSIFEIGANGYVGIGTSTPWSKLAIGPKSSITTTENTLTDGAAININWIDGNQQKVVLGGNRTISFTNYSAGAILRLILCQDATGNRTITAWPAVVLWQGGTAPTLTTTANKCDVLTFVGTGATSTLTVLGAAATNF